MFHYILSLSVLQHLNYTITQYFAFVIRMNMFSYSNSAIGTFLFEERIGCLEDNPTPQAQDFISNLKSYFHLMQPLMYNLPIYKIFRTKLWKQFEFHADEVMRIGRLFVDKVKKKRPLQYLSE